jgi:hypothetical protein
VIRGISDLLEGKSEADAAGSQERAADAASAVAFEILATLPPESIGPRARTMEAPAETVALRSAALGLREGPTRSDAPEDVRSANVEIRGAGQPSSAAVDRLAAAAGLNVLNATLAQALERDFSLRYSAAVRGSLFEEARKTNSFQLLARELIEGPAVAISSGLRRKVLLHAARSTAVRGEIQDAERFLASALTLSGDDPEAPALARLAQARGQVDEAIRLLRDRQDADSRSTLFNILYRARGDDAALEFLGSNNLSVADLTMNGIHTLCVLHLKRDNLNEVMNVLNQVSEEQFGDGPYLLLLRGGARLARIMHEGENLSAADGEKGAIHVANRCPDELHRGSTLRHSRHDRRYSASLRPSIGSTQEAHS